MPGSSTMTQDKVRAIIDETIKSFTEGDSFLEAIRKAVRESVQAELAAIIERVEVNEGMIMDLEKRVQEQSTKIDNLTKSLDQERELVKGIQRGINAQEEYSRSYANKCNWHG